MSNISTFRSTFAKRGPAKGNRFQVVFHTNTLNPVLTQNMSYMQDLVLRCTDASLAGKSLLTNDIRYYGPARKMPYQTQFADLTLQFYTVDEMDEKKFFNEWIDYVHGSGSYDFNFPDQYHTTLSIEKLSEIGNENMMTMILNKVYPVNLQSIPLSWQEEGLVRTIIQFAFYDYEIL